MILAVFLTLALALMLATTAIGAEPTAAAAPATPAKKSAIDPLAPLLAAMRAVESSGDDRAIGDGGRSIGPYQISLAYWTDGGGDARRYRLDAWSAARCRPVILGYWRRYAAASLARADLQALSRIHNGGPAGARKAATLPYWRKVRAAMAAAAKSDPKALPNLLPNLLPNEPDMPPVYGQGIEPNTERVRIGERRIVSAVAVRPEPTRAGGRRHFSPACPEPRQ